MNNLHKQKVISEIHNSTYFLKRHLLALVNLYRPISTMLEFDCFEIFSALVKNQANVNFARNIDEGTLLLRAVTKRKSEFVEVLVKNGSNVNCVNPFNQTPLHGAAFYGDTEIAKILIRNFAKIDAIWDVAILLALKWLKFVGCKFCKNAHSFTLVKVEFLLIESFLFSVNRYSFWPLYCPCKVKLKKQYCFGTFCDIKILFA